MNPSLRFMADLGERAGRSFIQGFFGLWLVNPHQPIDFDTLFTVANLKAGLVMAVMAVGMSLLGKPIGNPDSGSVLPPQAQPPAPQPADPTLKPEDAAPPPPEPEPVGLTDVEQLRELMRLIQPIAQPAPPPPPPAQADTMTPADRKLAELSMMPPRSASAGNVVPPQPVAP